MKTYAVITGDIINFTRLTPANRHLLIEDSEKLLKSWIKKSADAEIYRGDSFQVLFEDITEALNRSIQLLCWFKLRSDQVNNIALGTNLNRHRGSILSGEKCIKFRWRSFSSIREKF